MRLLVEASVICGHFVMEGLSTSTLDLLEPSGYKSYVRSLDIAHHALFQEQDIFMVRVSQERLHRLKRRPYLNLSCS